MLADLRTYGHQIQIRLLLQWYSLSDPAIGEVLIETQTKSRFAGITLISDLITDKTTILSFRHMLERHDLGVQIFETVKTQLRECGMTMRHGTIVDVILIVTPCSTKTKRGRAIQR